MHWLAPALWSLPWVLLPAVVLVRARQSRSLDEYSEAALSDAPLVSVVIPARDERRNIERCVRSVLATRYPALEVIVVDDHSTDGTGAIARTIASEDGRVRVVDAPDLPPDWFGKQWACATGAAAARGSLLLFTDADTRHAPDLVPRAVNALRERAADLLTVAGHQEMHSFWERVIQPQVFVLLALRYGGSEQISRARRPEDAIANGQFILVRRGSYDAMGGHALVRDRVAEDLSLAQEWVRAKKRLVMLFAMEQLSTHMYASLRELVAGWRKNVYAGGRHAALGGRVGRAVYPAMLLVTPLLGVAPPIVFVLALCGALPTAWFVWSVIVVAVSVAFWAVIYRFMRVSVVYAGTYPLGAAMLWYIAVGSVVRGNRVEWKERTYVAR